MPSTIITKNGSGAPLAADLVAGELAVDLTNGRLYTENSGGSVIEIGLNPSGNVDVTGTVTADGLTVASTGEVVSTVSSTSTTGTRGAKLRLNVASTGGDDPAGTIEFTYGTGYTVAGSIAMSHTNPNMKFFTGTTERMRIATTGQLLVGSGTSPASGEVKQTLARAGSSYLEFQNTSTNTGSTIGTSGEDFIVYTNSGALGSEVYTERMRIDSSGNVGIGTTSPGGKLSIRATSFAGSDSHFGFGANNDIYLTYGSTGNTIVRTIDGLGANSEKMRIDSSGNVGIDVVPSSWSTVRALQVGHAHVGALVDNAYFGANSYYDGSNWRYIATNEANRIDMQAGNIQFWTAPSGTAGSVISQTQAMTLDASGNLLVGRTSRLVNQVRSISSDTVVSAHGVLSSHQTNAAIMQYTSNQMLLRSYGATAGTGEMVFQTGGGGGSPDSEAMRIDSSGTLLVGKTASNTNVAGTEIYSGGNAGVMGLTYAGRSLYLNRLTTDGDMIEFAKDGTTVGSIGSYTGSAIEINGNTGSFANMVFGGSSLIFPSVDNVTDLGANSKRFDDIYATNGTIQTSDRNEKQDIEELNEAEHRVAVACKGLMRKFRWKSSVEENGDDARIHFGIIAQDLQAAFEAEGLDAGRYAMFTSNTWTDEETGEERSLMGVRYSELLAFIIAAI